MTIFSTINALLNRLMTPQESTKNRPQNERPSGKNRESYPNSVEFDEKVLLSAQENFRKKTVLKVPKKCDFPEFFDFVVLATPYQRLDKNTLCTKTCLALRARTTAHDYDIISDFRFIL